MAFFTWSPSYSVNVKEMDEQHKMMIDILDRLHEAMRVGKGSKEMESIIEENVKYTQFHFSSEEKILSSTAYPGFLKQKAEHDGFTKKILDFKTQYQQGKIALSIEVLNFLKEWWTNHIQGEDKKYGSYLNGKGIT